MNLTIENMRDAVIKVYGNDTWEARVKGMSDLQVMAIYHNFLEHGKIVVEKSNASKIAVGQRAKINVLDDALIKERERVKKQIEEFYRLKGEV